MKAKTSAKHNSRLWLSCEAWVKFVIIVLLMDFCRPGVNKVKIVSFCVYSNTI